MTVTVADQVILTVATSPGIPLGYYVDSEVGQVASNVPDHDASILAKLIVGWYPVGAWLCAGLIPTVARTKEIRATMTTQWTKRLALLAKYGALLGPVGPVIHHCEVRTTRLIRLPALSAQHKLGAPMTSCSGTNDPYKQTLFRATCRQGHGQLPPRCRAATAPSAR